MVADNPLVPHVGACRRDSEGMRSSAARSTVPQSSRSSGRCRPGGRHLSNAVQRINLLSGYRLGLKMFVVLGVTLAVGWQATTCWCAQDAVTPARSAADQAFAADLQEIAAWCREQNRPDLAAKTLELNPIRDPQRIMIFLPTAPTLPRTAEPASLEAEWQERLAASRQNYAQALLAHARNLAEQGEGGEAYRLLHECLHWDPELESVRRALGHKPTENGWQPYSERVKVRPAQKVHPVTKWPAGDYRLIVTDDFEIATRADEATSLHLAEQLQRWHWVWRQIFFDIWGQPRQVARWLDGKGQPPRPSRKFQVVFFEDQTAYVERLAPLIPGIEISTGYYSDDYRAAFFYASQDKSIEATWRHELTHQLFKETINSIPSPFRQNFLWLGEGIALYMESLLDFDSWVTLGGFDAAKLQYARARKLREAFHIPVADLNAMSAETLQRHPEVRRIYSEMTGLAHFLMHADGGKYRQPLVNALDLIYRGRLKPDRLSTVLGLPLTEIDRKYADFLEVEPNAIHRYLLSPESVSQLCLPRVPLDDDAFQVIGRCHGLIWLDVSGSAWNAKRAQWLAGCQHLDQLFLREAAVERGGLEALQIFPALVSLDLTSARADAETWRELEQLTGLVELSIAHTAAEDSLVPHLLRLNRLRSLNLTGTRITAAGINQLRDSLPDLTIIQGEK